MRPYALLFSVLVLLSGASAAYSAERAAREHDPTEPIQNTDELSPPGTTASVPLERLYEYLLGPRHVQDVLDAEFPDDHGNLQASLYPSERYRAAKAGQLAAAEIMVLDEILQSVHDDAACRGEFVRGSADYAACTAELYGLPTLLERLAVDRDCPASLDLPSRVSCLHRVETIISGRRRAMQTHTSWTKRLFDLDAALSIRWLNDGAPPAAVWGRFPEARQIAELDALMVYVHATSIATAIQAAELYDAIVAAADDFVLGQFAEPVFIEHAREGRRVNVINARNRFVGPWGSRPGVKLAHPRNPDWLRGYALWLSAARFGTGEAGMLRAGPEAFDIREPEVISLPEEIPYDIAPSLEARSDGPPPVADIARREKPVIWVRGGAPIRIPPADITPAARSDETMPPELSGPAPEPAPIGAPAPEQLGDELAARGHELAGGRWPEILLPRALAECRLRWEPFVCEETTAADVVAYAAESVNERLGTPAFVAAAAPRQAVRMLAKRADLIGSLVESTAHFRAGRPVDSLAALFGLFPGMEFNPMFQRDIPHWRTVYENARQQALATGRAGDLLIAGHREAERQILGTREIRAMPEIENDPED